MVGYHYIKKNKIIFIKIRHNVSYQLDRTIINSYLITQSYFTKIMNVYERNLNWTKFFQSLITFNTAWIFFKGASFCADSLRRILTSSYHNHYHYHHHYHSVTVGQHGSAWHTAEVEISSAYRAFSKEKVMGTLGVNIGLNSVNVTLKALPLYNQSSDIDYNERFHWLGATQIREEYRAALHKGLPFPILTVGEYFTVDAEGFCWGRNYREAGYYTSIFLW